MDALYAIQGNRCYLQVKLRSQRVFKHQILDWDSTVDLAPPKALFDATSRVSEKPHISRLQEELVAEKSRKASKHLPSDSFRLEITHCRLFADCCAEQ
jgi:hypothetical protein